MKILDVLNFVNVIFFSFAIEILANDNKNTINLVS